MLLKEMERFEKEHQKKMKQFYNERFSVRESMRSLRNSRTIANNNNINSLAQNTTYVGRDLIHERKKDRSYSHMNSLCTQSFSKQKDDNTITSTVKTIRNPLRIRSMSVPNLTRAMTGSADSRKSPGRPPGDGGGPEHFDLNVNKVVTGNLWVKTTCMWSRENTQDNDEHKTQIPQADNQMKNHQRATNDFSAQTRRRTRSVVIQKECKKTTDRRPQQTLALMPPRPNTSQALRYSRTNSFNTGFKDREFSPILRDVNISRRFPVEGNVLLQSEVYKLTGSRPMLSSGSSSCTIMAGFRTASDTVIAMQQLIKSYRRQQAIEKATEEHDTKRKLSPRKTQKKTKKKVKQVEVSMASEPARV